MLLKTKGAGPFDPAPLRLLLHRDRVLEGTRADERNVADQQNACQVVFETATFMI